MENRGKGSLFFGAKVSAERSEKENSETVFDHFGVAIGAAAEPEPSGRMRGRSRFVGHVGRSQPQHPPPS